MLTPSRSLTPQLKARLSSLIPYIIKASIFWVGAFLLGEVVEIGNFGVALVWRMHTYALVCSAFPHIVQLYPAGTLVLAFWLIVLFLIVRIPISC